MAVDACVAPTVRADSRGLAWELVDSAKRLYRLTDDSSDWFYLPEGGYPDLLNDTDSRYDGDRVKECMNRCLDAFTGAKAFYVKTNDSNKKTK